MTARTVGGKGRKTPDERISGGGARPPAERISGGGPRPSTPSLDLNDVIPDDAVLIKGTSNHPYEQWTYGELQDMGFLGPGATWNDYLEQTQLSSALDRYLLDTGIDAPPGSQLPSQFDLGLEPSTGSGRGRRGTGAAAAVYVALDRAAVEENMRAYVIAATGEQDANIVKGASDAWLAADRANFNSAAPKDPNVAAKSFVRNTAKYKDLHELRDPSEDELDWVTSRQGKLRSLGLSSSRAAALGIQQARVGSDDAALQRAAEATEVTDTGRLLDSQRERLKAKGRAALELI